MASDANFKDIYATFNYRFNLERDKESRVAIQAAGPTGPHDHTYLNFGTYYFYGRSVQRLLGAAPDGTASVVTAREPFYRVGGTLTSTIAAASSSMRFTCMGTITTCCPSMPAVI